MQVLFAFLLAVPFNQGFAKATTFQKDIYLVTLLLTAVATALLIAPSAYHRIEFRKDDKHHIVFMANTLRDRRLRVPRGGDELGDPARDRLPVRRVTADRLHAGAAMILFGSGTPLPVARRRRRCS